MAERQRPVQRLPVRELVAEKQHAQAKAGRARYFRERLRALLFNAFLADWETLYKALASRVKRVVVHDTSVRSAPPIPSRTSHARQREWLSARR